MAQPSASQLSPMILKQAAAFCAVVPPATITQWMRCRVLCCSLCLCCNAKPLRCSGFMRKLDAPGDLSFGRGLPCKGAPMDVGVDQLCPAGILSSKGLPTLGKVPGAPS